MLDIPMKGTAVLQNFGGVRIRLKCLWRQCFDDADDEIEKQLDDAIVSKFLEKVTHFRI